MDIRRWGLHQVMQLPDECFGRRFMVSCNLQLFAATRAWDISEVALPEACVIWELYIESIGIYSEEITVRIALGDQLPAVVAVFNALDPLFMGFGAQGPEPRGLYIPVHGRIHINRLRMPVAAAGRRMVIEALTPEAVKGGIFVGIVVSGIPKEVPDWLISGNRRSL